MDARSYLLADDDERRAIERALHDSVQQRLVSLAVELQAARSAVEGSPEEVTRLLEDARADLGQALDEVRAVAQRIHPPLLDTQGLMAALRMSAAAAPVATRVEGAIEGHLPPEAAVTVYRCCVAALAGVEGADSRATVAIGERDGVLEFAIDVAGGRIDATQLDAVAGRVGLLGGTLEVAPARIAGGLPVTSPHHLPPGT